MSSARVGDWDMTPYFPEFDGEVYRRFRSELVSDIAALQGELDAESAPLDEQSIERWAERLCRLEELAARSSKLGSYLGCLGAADSRNEAIARETASAEADYVGLDKCFTLVHDVLGSDD